jgi:hypothetical protein
VITIKYLLNITLFASVAVSPSFAAEVVVRVYPTTLLSLGGIKHLERDKYFLIHGTPNEIPREQLAWLRERTSAPFSRTVNMLSHALRETPPDPARPGHKNREALLKKIDELVDSNNMAGDPEWKTVGFSMHPQDLISANNEGWGSHSDEGRAEAIILMLNRLIERGVTPSFFETMNEPRLKLRAMEVDMRRVVEFHRNIIPLLKRALPDIRIGGYAEYNIRFNDRDFANWREGMGMYIEGVGEPGDFVSFHPYAIAPRRDRIMETVAGSVIEASVDLVAASIEQQFGRRVPMFICEYGLAGMAGRMSLLHAYSARRDFEIIREINGQLMSYLSRPDMIMMAIPFIVPHSEWWPRSRKFTPENPNSPWELFHNQKGAWRPTHLVKFYEFWEPAKGKHIIADADDIDVQVAAFSDSTTVWVAAHNHCNTDKKLKLEFSEFHPLRLEQTHIAIINEEPALTKSEIVGSSATLSAGSTLLFRAEMEDDYPVFRRTILRETAFARPTLVKIEK